MRQLLSFLLLVPFAGISQTTLQASSKVIVDDGYDYTELSVTPWGGSHGIFFGSKVNYTGTNDLWSSGNSVYARDAGQYTYGAFSMGYIANGGYFSFYDGGLSTGVGNQITWNPVMTMRRGGSIGLGTINPQTKLHVVGGEIIETSGSSSNARTLTLMNAGTSQMNFGYYSGSWRSAIQIQNNNATKALFFAPPETDYNYSILRSINGGIKFDVGGTASDAGTNAFTIETNGNIGINTVPFSQYKLAVNGDAIFTKVKVKTYATWPDYVFHHNYKLRPLKELENYIKQNNRLPDVPSANDVEKNGLDIGDNQAILLKKIEELTLYIIDQDKKIKSQEKQIIELLELKKDLDTIKSQLKIN